MAGNRELCCEIEFYQIELMDLYATSPGHCASEKTGTVRDKSGDFLGKPPAKFVVKCGLPIVLGDAAGCFECVGVNEIYAKKLAGAVPLAGGEA